MPQKNRSRKFARVATCAAFGVFLVLAGSVAAAYAEDDEDSMLPDEKFMRSFLRKLGLRNGQEAGIEYQERPPLVVPPNRDLPPPVAGNTLIKNNLAWPTDPDETQRKNAQKAKTARKVPLDAAGNFDDQRDVPDPAGRKSQPSAPGGPVRPSAAGAGPNGGTAPEMTPSELGYTGGLWDSFWSIGNTFSTEKKPEVGRFVREPPRASLTDPPSGYRTPSPNQIYGINAKDVKGKAQTVEERQSEGVANR